jgi:hypothetical protein
MYKERVAHAPNISSDQVYSKWLKQIHRRSSLNFTNPNTSVVVPSFQPRREFSHLPNKPHQAGPATLPDSLLVLSLRLPQSPPNPSLTQRKTLLKPALERPHRKADQHKHFDDLQSAKYLVDVPFRDRLDHRLSNGCLDCCFRGREVFTGRLGDGPPGTLLEPRLQPFPLRE